MRIVTIGLLIYSSLKNKIFPGITQLLNTNISKISLVFCFVFLSLHLVVLSDGTWKQSTELRGSSRDGAVGFSIGNRGYIGTGYDGAWRSDFWEYNPDTDTWRQRAVFGGGDRRGAVGFSIGNRGYIGTGYNRSWRKDFWEYNPSTNSWTQKAEFPGQARESAVGFSIGTRGYIGTGWEGQNLRDFWEYNPDNNSWTRKADFGGTARAAAVGFSIGDRGYIGTGYDGEWKRDFWEYNPSSNAWTRKADFGGTARLGAVGFSIGEKGYIGTGLDIDWAGKKKDMWEYNPSSNSWKQKSNFGGVTRLGAVGFSIGTKGYLGTGWVGFTERDFWEFDPAGQSVIVDKLITVSPGDKNYGVVIEGHSSTQIFNIENPHDTEVSGTIFLTGVSADQYKIADGGESFTLGPGESTEIVVVFQPLGSGLKEAAFNVNPMASDPSSNIEVILRGEGIHVDYAAQLRVSDVNENAVELIFGTTDIEINLNYDQYAPSVPPSGEFDARFRYSNQDLIKDLRSTTVTQNIWNLVVQSSSGGYPMTLEWNSEQLDEKGRFLLVDAVTGERTINVDMRTSNSFALSSSSMNELFIIHSIIETQSVVTRTGWNLVGLPLISDDTHYSSLFPGAISGTLYHFDGVYRQSESLKSGIGYWLRFTKEGGASLQGEYINDVEIDLAQGWNIISGPSEKSSVSAIKDPNNIIIPGTVYGFEGTYIRASEIKPGQGYWIRASKEGSINITGGEIVENPVGKVIAGETQDLDDFNRLVFTQNDGKDHILYFGGQLENDISIDQYSLPPISPGTVFDVRFADHRYLSNSDKVDILLQSVDSDLKVEFIPSFHKNDGAYVLYELKDVEVVGETILNGKMEFSLSAADVDIIQILPYTKVFDDIPEKFILSQNYPNPFNPSTNIKYALPSDVHVKLEVFNILGQRVDVLVDEYQEAGYYNVTFESRDLPSGTYLYRIQAGQFVDIKRFLLLK